MKKTFKAIVGLILVAPLWAISAEPLPVVVRAQHEGNLWQVDADFIVPASLATTWAVLTDFEHMSSFLPNLEASRVLNRKDQHLLVEQSGRARYGIFSMDFKSVREIDLIPMRRISAHTLQGSVKRMDSVAEIEPVFNGTRVHYHADWEPTGWWSQFLGVEMVQDEVNKQFTAMAAEMIRRQQRDKVGTEKPAWEKPIVTP